MACLGIRSSVRRFAKIVVNMVELEADRRVNVGAIRRPIFGSLTSVIPHFARAFAIS